MPLVCVLRVFFVVDLLARPSSIRTLLLSGFVVLFSILSALFFSEWFS